MTGSRATRMSGLCLIALAACQPAGGPSKNKFAENIQGSGAVGLPPAPEEAGKPVENTRALPAKYIKAFECRFDENPVAAARRHHETPAGRAERAADLTRLKALGFNRKGRDGDLESVGGKIPAPPDLTVLGLPVRFLELNGMIGDANAMYVTTFDGSVTTNQVVKAARLEMDRELYGKYKMRHYRRRVDSTPYVEFYLDERGGASALLVCQVRSVPD